MTEWLYDRGAFGCPFGNGISKGTVEATPILIAQCHHIKLMCPY